MRNHNLGLIFLTIICCVWPVVVWLVFSNFRRLWNGITQRITSLLWRFR